MSRFNIFISYDEPSAEKRYNELKSKYPRTKWCKGVKGRTLLHLVKGQTYKISFIGAAESGSGGLKIVLKDVKDLKMLP